MDYMFTPGFFGTQDPFFMDLATLVVALLPFALLLGILFARKGLYDLHRWYQWFLFLGTVLVLGWFEYGIRAGGGFRLYAARSSLPSWLLLGTLGLHILIALLTLIWWLRTLLRAQRRWRRHDLPGGFSLRHIREGRRSAWGIFLTALTGIWIYLALFVLVGAPA